MNDNNVVRLRPLHKRIMGEEAKRERKIIDSAEAQMLQDAICDAVLGYCEFLDRHNLIWGAWPAQALVIACNFSGDDTIDIRLKGGALDRVSCTNGASDLAT